MLERGAEPGEKKRHQDRRETHRLAERDKCESARGRAESEQVARTEALGGQADRGLKDRGRAAPRRTDHADLHEREAECLRQYRQQYVTHVGQAVVQYVRGATGRERAFG